MDVHVRRAVTAALRLRSIDVLTAQEDGAAEFDERSSMRGTKMMASRIAAAAATRKSVLERGRAGLGEMGRRGPAMVALTCGSVETGIGAREGVDFVLVGGSTGESGTESGSICGSGARCAVREVPLEVAPEDVPEAAAAEACAAAGAEEAWTAAVMSSGESGS